jgi:hypothetical protein
MWQIQTGVCGNYKTYQISKAWYGSKNVKYLTNNSPVETTLFYLTLWLTLVKLIATICNMVTSISVCVCLVLGLELILPRQVFYHFDHS